MSGEICRTCGRFKSGYSASARCSCPEEAPSRLLPGVSPDSEDHDAVAALARKQRETIRRWYRQTGAENAAEIEALVAADEAEKAEAARVEQARQRRREYLNDRYELEHGGAKPPVLDSPHDQSWANFIRKVEAEEAAERERAEAAEARRENRRRRASATLRQIVAETEAAERAEAAALRASARQAAGYQPGQPARYQSIPGAVSR